MRKPWCEYCCYSCLWWCVGYGTVAEEAMRLMICQRATSFPVQILDIRHANTTLRLRTPPPHRQKITEPPTCDSVQRVAHTNTWIRPHLGSTEMQWMWDNLNEENPIALVRAQVAAGRSAINIIKCTTVVCHRSSATDSKQSPTAVRMYDIHAVSGAEVCSAIERMYQLSAQGYCCCHSTQLSKLGVHIPYVACEFDTTNKYLSSRAEG